MPFKLSSVCYFHAKSDLRALVDDYGRYSVSVFPIVVALALPLFLFTFEHVGALQWGMKMATKLS